METTHPHLHLILLFASSKTLLNMINSDNDGVSNKTFSSGFSIIIQKKLIMPISETKVWTLVQIIWGENILVLNIPPCTSSYILSQGKITVGPFCDVDFIPNFKK